MSGWTPERMRRFAQHVLLPDVGGRGQDRLREATVAIELGGAVAHVAAAYLAAGGIGTIVLVGVDREVSPALARFPLGGAAGRSLREALEHALGARHAETRIVAAVEPPEGAHVLVLDDDHERVPAAEAFARGGEAAARLMHAIATERR